MTNGWIRYLKTDPNGKRLLFEACVFLGISRIVLMTVRFKYIAGFLERADKRCVGPAEGPQQLLSAKAVGTAVETMSRHTFWHSSCLVKALAAKLMLTRRGIRCRLSLGLARDPAGTLVAHAWTTAYGITLTGAEGAEGFIVLSNF